MDYTSYIQMQPEVRDALGRGAPVVALESTIVAHGMPFPQNLESAREVEAIVRSLHALPATIAIVHGRIKIGLSPEELELLARSGNSVGKVSRRDFGHYLSNPHLIGATTVASTMMCASMAGIRVFVTGGIGGVHRGAEQTGDVSADLPEFTRSGVAVVSAGAKAILDIPKTLEYLETLGIPVIGFRTAEFPAFYSRSSGLMLESVVDDFTSLANYLRAHWAVAPNSGVLIANPVPQEYQIPREEIEPWILQVLAEASSQGISGKSLTPYLLRRLAEVTAGRSLVTNRALVRHNASIGAALAVELARNLP